MRGGELHLPGTGDLNDVSPPVRGVAASDDQTRFFELIQESNDVAGVEAQDLREPLLGQWPALVEKTEGVKMPRAQSAWRGARFRGATAEAGQVIEQWKRLEVRLRRYLVHAPIVYV